MERLRLGRPPLVSTGPLLLPPVTSILLMHRSRVVERGLGTKETLTTIVIWSSKLVIELVYICIKHKPRLIKRDLVWSPCMVVLLLLQFRRRIHIPLHPYNRSIQSGSVWGSQGEPGVSGGRWEELWTACWDCPRSWTASGTVPVAGQPLIYELCINECVC